MRIGKILEILHLRKAVLSLLGVWYSRRMRTFLLFVGNPRSGTTLTRSLLDAHEHMLVGNEAHVLKHLKKGTGWYEMLGLIVRNAKRFRQNPVWTDYSYKMSPVVRAAAPTVIGDKKAFFTTYYLSEYPELLERLKETIPVPLRFLHVVRHPFDVITTVHNRTGIAFADCIDRYFEVEKEAARIGTQFGKEGYHCCYHEQMVCNFDAVFEEILSFLDVKSTTAYLNACRELLYPSPNKSRYKYSWSEEQRAEVERRTKNIPHLRIYLNNNQRLEF